MTRTWPGLGVSKSALNKVSKAEFNFIPLLTQCSYRENECVFNLGIYHPKLKDPKWGIEGWWRETMFTLLQLIYGIWQWELTVRTLLTGNGYPWKESQLHPSNWSANSVYVRSEGVLGRKLWQLNLSAWLSSNMDTFEQSQLDIKKYRKVRNRNGRQ